MSMAGKRDARDLRLRDVQHALRLVVLEGERRVAARRGRRRRVLRRAARPPARREPAHAAPRLDSHCRRLHPLAFIDASAVDETHRECLPQDGMHLAREGHAPGRSSAATCCGRTSRPWRPLSM